MPPPHAAASPYTRARSHLVEWLHTALIGPGPRRDTASDEFTINHTRPSLIYPSGILFPLDQEGAGVDPAAEPEPDDPDRDPDADERKGRPTVGTRRYVAPSAAGFSFFAASDIVFHATAWAVVYVNQSQRDHQWRREPLARHGETGATFRAPVNRQRQEVRTPIWPDSDGRARAAIHVHWRPYRDGWLVTLSLCNRQDVRLPGTKLSVPQRDRIFESSCLFEVELGCEILSGTVHAYPHKDTAMMDDEERELELRYRHRRIFAIGHGVAVDWQMDQDRVTALQTRFLPQVEVPLVTPQNPSIPDRTLALDFLRHADTSPEVFAALDEFVAVYAQWVATDQQPVVETLEGQARDDGRKILDRLEQARQRMAEGVDRLRRDAAAARAFALANEAMRHQWERLDRIRQGKAQPYRWRPFQLGFLLLTLESLVHRDSRHRDTVDLIWFPTGGGKTEAYLALIALQILYRRLRYPTTGDGTTVIMRYTLRLLTQQQFERAARVIGALEVMRRDRPQELGSTPITAGMWVGAESTPNTFKDALRALHQATPEKPPRCFVLTHCPWCGHALWHPQNGSVTHGFHASETDFAFRCLNRECDFGVADAGTLPLNVVDEALYAHPPTLLFATVDKFARLAWEPRTAAFFGQGRHLPPELIVQDELHLIASALGSIVGVYEAALDAVLIQQGIYPKYIASTATIRNAARHIQRLFGREHAVFPPPGIDAEDSFFTRTVPVSERPGRLYVGYLASHMRKEDAFAALAAALLGAPLVLFPDDADLQDAWWTMVVYHGSLRGVGDSHNALLYKAPAPIQRHLERMANRNRASRSVHSDRTGQRGIAQITSRRSAEENARTFARLEHRHDHPEPLDAVLATNMIAVGLDVDRLALMVVNGQPLTTAEYIQASSRVGRSQVPGVVVANYYRWQARSLSHYEHFRPYHESFYRFVEPTSITPFTPQARRRALHAALVILMRHGFDFLRANDAVDRFRPAQTAIRRAMTILARRCRRADPHRSDQTEAQLDDLAREWEAFLDDCRRNRRRSVYQQPPRDRSSHPLLCTHQDRHRGRWATLNSMRHVEDEGLLRIRRQGGESSDPDPTLPIPVRQSHLIGFCGPGSIVRSADTLLVPMDTRRWQDRQGRPLGARILRVRRIRVAMGIADKELHAPPTGQVDRSQQHTGHALPAVRFPSWMQCESCGRLYRDTATATRANPRLCVDEDCPRQGRPLVQVPWVLVHPRGYLDDIPWHWLAHRQNDRPACRQCREDGKLYWKDGRLTCRCCRAGTDLSPTALMATDFFTGLRRMRQQPWHNAPVPPETLEATPPVGLEVGDARLYQPLVRRGLVIPPESRLIASSPEQLLAAMPEELDRLQRARSNPHRFRARCRLLAGTLNCSPEAVASALAAVEAQEQGDLESFSEPMLAAEFKALTTPIPDLKEEEDFITCHHTGEWRALRRNPDLPIEAGRIAHLVHEVIAVRKLREIVVFKGFKRAVGEENDEIAIVPPDLTGEQPWLPALELFGEGIFLTFTESILQRWERDPAVAARVQVVQRRLEQSPVTTEVRNKSLARTILLHTLAHLMIRQIEFDSGYPAAELKERLYVSSAAGGGRPMAGILVYVSVADKAGSLGGLFETAVPQRLLRLLVRAFAHAQWCSLDPVCAAHEGQGPGLLNRAACHGCTLIPETACLYNNTLLDRVLVKGALPVDGQPAVPAVLDFVDQGADDDRFEPPPL